MAELKIVHDSWELNKLFRISRSSKKTAETLEVQISKIKDGLTKFNNEPYALFMYMKKLVIIQDYIQIKDYYDDTLLSGYLVKDDNFSGVVYCLLYKYN